MKKYGIRKGFLALFCGWCMLGAAATPSAAGTTAVAPAGTLVEKRSVLESVKSDLEKGLGLTAEQKSRIKVIRDDFKARQAALRNAINASNESLRKELDSDVPARARVEPIITDIKALQGQLTDNRVDVVFKLREVYTARQIKLIKEQARQQNKAIGKKTKSGKAGKAAGKTRK